MARFAFYMDETTELTLPELTERDQATLEEYLKSFNATRAWMATHPNSSYNSARASSSEWLAKPNIKAAIQERIMGADEAKVLISDIARGDVAQLMDVSSMGFNLDMTKAKEAGLTKLIKKVKQKTTTYLAKSESQEDREVTELEIELYNAHEAARDILKVHGQLGDKSERENVPPGAISASVDTMRQLLDMIEERQAAAVDRARAIDAESTNTRNE